MIDRMKAQGFLYLIMIFPLIDIFNGVFISYGHNIPLGTAYRIFFIVYIIYGVLSKGIKLNGSYALLIISLFLFIILCIVQTIFFETTISLLIEEFSYVIRFSLCLLIPFFANQFEEYLSIKKIMNVAISLNVLLIGGLIIPYFLGLGNSTYDDTAGFKGFYFATNDIAYAFLIMLFFMGWLLIQRKRRSIPAGYLLILYFLDMYCLLILGTKSGLLAGLIYSIYLIFHFLYRYRSQTLYEQFFVFEFLLAMLFFLLVKGKEFILGSLSGVLQRFAYFRTLYQDDWVRLFMSSRNVYLKEAVDNFLQLPDNQYIFWFGQGFENRWNWYGRRGGLVEMDFFDMFFSYGIIGTMILIAVIVYFLKVALYQKANKFSIFLLVFTIIYSLLVGHVFFSALSATVFGFMCMFIQEVKKEQVCQE
ncbi:O-antigen ligase family protein [Enterococcus alishanensis]